LFKAHAGKFPDKPDNLRAFELMKSMRLNIVDGGFLDQPCIWTLQYEAISQVVAMFDQIATTPPAQS
jgi:hypothetical protein